MRERIGGSLKADMTIEEIVKKVSEISSVPEKEIVGKVGRWKLLKLDRYLCFYPVKF